MAGFSSSDKSVFDIPISIPVQLNEGQLQLTIPDILNISLPLVSSTVYMNNTLTVPGAVDINIGIPRNSSRYISSSTLQ